MQTYTPHPLILSDYLDPPLLTLLSLASTPQTSPPPLTPLLLLLANRHGLTPRCYTHLPSTSTPLYRQLRQDYHHIAHYNMLLSSQLLRIVARLHASHIPLLILKGAPLAQIAYGDITLRQYGDIDLLVESTSLLRVAHELITLGYHSDTPITLLHNPTCLAVESDVTFRHPNGVTIELHWRLFREKIAKHPTFSQLYQTHTLISLQQRAIPILSTEIHLVYLCLHGGKHAWERIAWIYDLDQLIRSHPTLDWEKAEAFAKEIEAQRSVWVGLALTHHLFGTPLPPSIPYDQTTHTLIQETLTLLNSPTLHHHSYRRYYTIQRYQRRLLPTQPSSYTSTAPTLPSHAMTAIPYYSPLPYASSISSSNPFG